jgi:hypothetical protein
LSETTHSPSLREALAASYDAHAGTDTGDSAPAPADTGAAPDTAQAPADAAAAPSGSERQRDASGRFAPAAAQPGATAGTDAPDGYDAAVWAMLSPEARAQTAAWAGKQRETVAERETRLKAYEPIDRVLTQQRRDGLAMQYGSVDHALEQLFHLSDFAARDPNGFVRQFAAQRGVNLAQLMEQAQGGQQAPQQQQYTPQQAIQAMVQQEIDRRDVDRLYTEFAGQADLEHRNDPQVRTTMAALLAANQARDYRQAYDMAVRAHPDFGPKQLQALAAERAKDQQADAAETARARASAASSLSGAPGTTRPSAGGGAPATVRDALQRAFDSAGGARV